MATITIKDIPVKVHKLLKEQAKRGGRSLNREILQILTEAVEPQQFDVETFLAEVRTAREKMTVKIDEEFLSNAKNSDRC